MPSKAINLLFLGILFYLLIGPLWLVRGCHCAWPAQNFVLEIVVLPLMPDFANSTATGLVIDAIRLVLERGSLAALATIVESPQHVGAKLLVELSEPVVGELGDANLNAAVVHFAKQFLETRNEAHTFVVSHFAPELVDHANTKILFERIQPNLDE